MVHFNIIRPRQEMVLASPAFDRAQAALIAAVWLAMMGAFGLLAVSSMRTKSEEPGVKVKGVRRGVRGRERVGTRVTYEARGEARGRPNE